MNTQSRCTLSIGWTSCGVCMGDSESNVPTATCGCSSIASYVGESKQCGTKKFYCIRQWSIYKVKEERIQGEGSTTKRIHNAEATTLEEQLNSWVDG